MRDRNACRQAWTSIRPEHVPCCPRGRNTRARIPYELSGCCDHVWECPNEFVHGVHVPLLVAPPLATSWARRVIGLRNVTRPVGQAADVAERRAVGDTVNSDERLRGVFMQLALPGGMVLALLSAGAACGWGPAGAKSGGEVRGGWLIVLQV